MTTTPYNTSSYKGIPIITSPLLETIQEKKWIQRKGTSKQHVKIKCKSVPSGAFYEMNDAILNRGKVIVMHPKIAKHIFSNFSLDNR